MSVNKKFTLDAPVKLAPETVEITIRTIGSGGYVIGQNSPFSEEVIVLKNTTYSEGQSVFYYKEKAVAILYHYTGELTFFEDFKIPPISQGVDNIEVKFEAMDSVDTDLEFLTYGDNTMVFYDSKNDMTVFTEYANLDYVPLSNYVKNKSLGAMSLGNSTIALFGENSISYLQRTVLEVGKQKKYTYSLTEGKPGVSLVAPDSTATLANDLLFLSETGVHALSLSNNITTNERYALERSAFINSKLLKHKDLSKAKAISHQNRYYLAIDDSVYIADARYKTSARDQDMNDTFNYEWWYWENVPVKEWIIIDGELKFITENGYIAEFTEERSDVKIHELTYADWGMVVNSDNYVQIYGAYYDLLKNTNKILCNGVVYDIYTDDNTKYNYQIKLMLDGNVVDTNTIRHIFNYNFDILEYTNVVSEWYSPIVNMGTSIYAKNLITSTLTFEPDVEGDVKFGYITRRKPETTFKGSNLSPDDGLDFEDLDFTDFSFNVNFACSRTLKTRTRNYNYIQFRIVSDSNKDCALNNFVVTYTYGRKNKGVR